MWIGRSSSADLKEALTRLIWRRLWLSWSKVRGIKECVDLKQRLQTHLTEAENIWLFSYFSLQQRLNDESSQFLCILLFIKYTKDLFHFSSIVFLSASGLNQSSDRYSVRQLFCGLFMAGDKVRNEFMAVIEDLILSDDETQASTFPIYSFWYSWRWYFVEETFF